MCLDHDLQNLAPLADDDREALESGYVAMANSIPGNPPKPLNPLNAVGCLIAQSRALIEAIIYAHVEGENPIDVEALYGVRSLLDAARGRISDAQEVANG